MNHKSPFPGKHKVTAGVLETLRPGLRRITANNPSPFTLSGTGTLVIGEGRVAVIDPGPDDPAHIDALMTALGSEVITHILVTHTHLDHSPGCQLLKERTDAPTYGFGPHGNGSPAISGEPGIDRLDLEGEAATDKAGDYEFIPDIAVGHNALITGDDWELQCLHTPGHASNHLCFAEPSSNSLYSGDHVMAWSTTVILQPDGNMGDYLQSLELLGQRNDAIYWPAHGGPVTEPQAYVRKLVEHRVKRQQQIIGAVSEGIDTVNTLLAVVYPDLRQALHQAALHSLLSTVVYLVDLGQLRVDGKLSFESRLFPR